MTAPAPPVIVLVTFYSRCGSTEALALAAAVGAVQARASIRLRRLPDANAAAVLEAVPDCRDTLMRMHKEYVAPAEADVLGADALILGVPPGATPAAAQWTAYLALLGRLHTEGKLAGKLAAVVDTGSEPTLASFSATLRQLGMTLVPPESSPAGGDAGADGSARAVAHGRKVAEAARLLKQAKT